MYGLKALCSYNAQYETFTSPSKEIAKIYSDSLPRNDREQRRVSSKSPYISEADDCDMDYNGNNSAKYSGWFYICDCIDIV